jgi:hypothetical protein
MTPAGLLLGADDVTLFKPDAADGHGWALPGTAPAWSGKGNLQLDAGRSDPEAAAGGGRGPYAPGASMTGQLFLPPDAEPAEGMAALVNGQPWALSQVRAIADPVEGHGSGIACWVATATGTAGWPPDEAG